MTAGQLQRSLSPYYPQYSLMGIATRKLNLVRTKRNLDTLDMEDISLDSALELGQDYEDGLNSLSRSDILSSDIEAMSLYFSLPYFSTPPYCTLIYSTIDHDRALGTLYSKTMKCNGPCLLLIKLLSTLPTPTHPSYSPTTSPSHSDNDTVFGAYLSHSIVPSTQWAGSPSCFLFNLTQGIKLPYHARNAADVGGDSPLAFLMQEDRMYIGYGDMSINADLLTGSSELENCYGLGMSQGTPETLCLLAGSPVFEIETLEVWDVSTSAR